MQTPASKSGRNRAPSLKGLLAMMAGFFIVFIILAELASATTSNQPAISPLAEQSVVATSQSESSAPADTVTPEPVATAEPTLRSLSYGANEVVKMYKGGVKADVLLTYIDTANLSYQLSSREILYLSQIGVPSEIVNSMIRHDHQMQMAQANAQQQMSDSQPMTEPTTSPVSYVQPVVVVQQPRVKYVSAPVCSAASQTGPNVTVIGSRYGSTFYNGCYYGPFSCNSPARSYYNSEFGPLCSYDFGYRDRFNYGGYGFGYGHRHWNRF